MPRLSAKTSHGGTGRLTALGANVQTLARTSRASEPLKSTCCAPTRKCHRTRWRAAPRGSGAYRRDSRKDLLLQENGYFVLRFLAEDVGNDLDAVLDAILRMLARRRQSTPRTEPLKFVQRGGE